MLARFCINIAKITSRSDLLAVVSNGLKQLGIEKYLLCLVDGENTTYGYHSFELGSELANQQSLPDIRTDGFEIKESLTEVVLNSTDPVIVSKDEILQQSKAKDREDLFLRSIGRDGLLGLPLRAGLRKIGVLWISNNILDIQILQAISSQISIALAYIIANEAVEKQGILIQTLKNEILESCSMPEKETDNHSKIIGTSASMEKVHLLLSQVSNTQTTVLLLGETGTGKEVMAKAIHENSSRKHEVMVTINCAAIPASLIESELFGHEKGSFTGAAECRIGKWELAHNGTLFLDEIGDMPLDLQAKLLRALQEKEIERIGGRNVIKTDVRVIAATNKDLQKEVKQGNFRSDLFFRLNIFPITIPPLRERKQDIPTLALHFMKKYAKKNGRKITGISSRAIKKLSAYNWPGNVRELENLIERGVLLATQPIISHIDLPEGEENLESVLQNTRVKTIDEVNREHIMDVLKNCKGRVAGLGGAAEVLKMPPTTLHSMIKRLGIKKQYLP